MNRRSLLARLLALFGLGAVGGKLAARGKIPTIGRLPLTPGCWTLLGRWRLAKIYPESPPLEIDHETFERWSDQFAKAILDREVIGKYVVFPVLEHGGLRNRLLYFERMGPRS